MAESITPEKLRELADYVQRIPQLSRDYQIDAAHDANTALRAAADQIERLADSLDGTRCDLRLAVETAYHRGATEWTRMNYPGVFADLQAAKEG